MFSKPAIFLTALVLSAAFPGAAVSPGLTIVSGNGQAVFEFQSTTTPLVLRVADPQGNPVVHAPVTWAITHGQGTLVGTTTTTDANGLASTNFVGTLVSPESFTSQTITATAAQGSANFYLTTVLFRNDSPMPVAQIVSPASDATPLSGTTSSVLPGALAVRVVAASGIEQGQPVPNIGVRIIDSLDSSAPPPATCRNGSGGTVLTDSTGLATCDLLLTAVPGTHAFRIVTGEFNISRTIPLQVNAGPSCTLSLSSSGQNFTGNTGTGTVGVTTGQGCGWTASSNSAWLLITSGASGTGSGAVTFQVLANTGAGRTAQLTIGGQTSTVIQAAGTPTGGGGNGGGGGNPGGGTPGPTPAITNTSFPAGSIGAPYQQSLGATGGCLGPFSPAAVFTVVAGALPPGLSIKQLDYLTSAIVGAPTAAGSYPFTLQVSDSCKRVGQAGFQIVINQGSPSVGLISAAPSTLQFTVHASDVSGPTAAVALTATATTAYTASINPSTGGVWLAFSGPSAGTTPSNLSVQVVNYGNLSPGTYAASIAITPAAGGQATVIPVTLTVAGGALIRPSPAAIGFVLTPGAAADTRPLDLQTTGGAVSYNASAYSVIGGNWLSISKSLGVAPDRIVVKADPTGLPIGNYRGFIAIVPVNPAGATQTVEITLTVAQPPSVAVTPPALTFSYDPAASAPAPVTVAVSSPSGTMAWSALSSASWLRLSPGQGNTPGAVSVSIDPTSVTAGNYSGMITFTSPGSTAPVVLPVSLAVAAPPTPRITAITNGASFLPGPVAPGEIVTVFGANLGPAALATYGMTSAGAIDTQINGARLLFDGVAAPLIYTRADQLTAIVPFGVAGKPFTEIRAEYNGQLSDPLTMTVATAVPAIFGTALNQDGTANAPGNGAEPGTVAVFFLTGTGQTDPRPADGSITQDASQRLTLQVSAEIGGITAHVEYAGGAPLAPAGLTQVNVRVPAGVTRGQPASVKITIGEAPTQPGIMLAIRP